VLHREFSLTSWNSPLTARPVRYVSADQSFAWWDEVHQVVRQRIVDALHSRERHRVLRAVVGDQVAAQLVGQFHARLVGRRRIVRRRDHHQRGQPLHLHDVGLTGVRHRPEGTQIQRRVPGGAAVVEVRRCRSEPGVGLVGLPPVGGRRAVDASDGVERVVDVGVATVLEPSGVGVGEAQQCVSPALSQFAQSGSQQAPELR
jgi:hypothetical protein